MRFFYFFALFTSILSAQVPTAGLIGQWPFSGNANDIVGTNNGTVFSATLTPDRFGNPNCAYKFNGSTSYILMANAGLTGTVSRSVSFWAKRSVSSGLQCAFDYGTPGWISSYHILFDYSCAGIGFDNGSTFQTRGNTNLANNNWHHFVVVYDVSISNMMNDMIYYIDGVPMSSSVTCGGNDFINSGATYPITIGRTADAPSRHFNGDLDDFFFYNRALTPTEVLALYNDMSCAGLPAAPGAINGNAVVCAGSTVVYSVSPVPGATSYTWTLPGGWTGVSTTNSISVTVGSSSGQIGVAAKNCCGGSQPVTLDISVSSCTGINEIKNGDPDIGIFPNPNPGIFYLNESLNGITELKIVNVLGQEVFSKTIEDPHRKIETKLSDGTYFVNFYHEKVLRSIQRLVVVNE